MSRFSLLKRMPRFRRVNNRIVWVEGYVCALEDVINGLEHQIESYAGLTHPDVLTVMDFSLEHVQSVLATAQDTLTQLQAVKMEEPRVS